MKTLKANIYRSKKFLPNELHGWRSNSPSSDGLFGGVRVLVWKNGVIAFTDSSARVWTTSYTCSLSFACFFLFFLFFKKEKLIILFSVCRFHTYGMGLFMGDEMKHDFSVYGIMGQFIGDEMKPDVSVARLHGMDFNVC